jgi:hypothetical protein
LTQPVDLMPTLLDAFAVSPPVIHGGNLLSLIRGEAQETRPYACSGGPDEWALRTHDWAFFLPVRSQPEDPRGPRLYVKPDDRWEVNDLAQHHPELSERLEKTLRGFMAATGRPGLLEAPPLEEPAEEEAQTPEGVNQP